MSLTANALKQNPNQKRAIESEVKAILTRVDDELKNAHSMGRHETVCTLPINISIPYMNNADSQRIVYFKVINSLVERGFHPSIELESERTLLFITWLSTDERKDIKYQSDILAKYTRKKIRDIDLSKYVNDDDDVKTK